MLEDNPILKLLKQLYSDGKTKEMCSAEMHIFEKSPDQLYYCKKCGQQFVEKGYFI